MAGLRNNNNTQNAQWADYVGDILRGAQPINQLVPQHPYLNDVPLIDELMNRPGFPGECFICELRLPDHRFRWKHNKLFLLLPEEYGPAFPA
ncbi:UNVERIFIED_CONTAM: hypothetical protein QJA12_19570, partial [Escherichia coli]